MIELRAGQAYCTIHDDVGARLGILRVGDLDLLATRSVPDADDERNDRMLWGSYPMVPWVGRIRNGCFRFDDVDYQMPINLPPHAIHGTAFTAPWTIEAQSDRRATLSFDLGPPWPFGGRASQTIELAQDHIDCALAVTAGDRAMPAQLGWHPWFVKPPSATIRMRRMYVRDEVGIPTGDLVPTPPGPWDDCFVEPMSPIELHFDQLTVTVSSDCDHWVVYDQPAHATCVEPQTGPPDGPNLAPVRLEPGETLSRSMRIAWREPDRESS